MDDYTKALLVLEPALSMASSDVICHLNNAISWFGKPTRIRTDNGSEFQFPSIPPMGHEHRLDDRTPSSLRANRAGGIRLRANSTTTKSGERPPPTRACCHRTRFCLGFAGTRAVPCLREAYRCPSEFQFQVSSGFEESTALGMGHLKDLLTFTPALTVRETRLYIFHWLSRRGGLFPLSSDSPPIKEWPR